MILKCRKYLQKYSELIFWIAVFLELAIYTLKKYDVVFEHQTWMLRGITVLLFCKILLTEYTKREWALIAAMTVLGVIAYFVSGWGIDMLLRASVLILASKGISCKRVFLAVWTSVLIVFLGWGIQSFMGLRPLYLVQQFGRGEDELRYCFGYSHPNTFHYAAWMLVAVGIYLWHEKMKHYHYVLFLIFTIVLTALTRSRTGGILMFATVILFWIVSKTQKSYRMPYILSAGAVVLLLTGSAIPIIFGYKDNIFRYINILLNNRIEMARAAVRFDRILYTSLFSNPANEIQIDMGFVRIVYTFGIVPTILFVGCIFYLLFHAYKTKNLWNLVLLMMTVCYTALEAVQVNSGILYNFVILLMLGSWAEYRVLRPERTEQRKKRPDGGNYAGTKADSSI
ncbi:MAG: hypothetical protein ACI4SE_05090 [Lachnospiraceae bacterium]